MKKYEFNSFDEFDESGTAGEWEALTVIRENGWIKVDLLTECKSYKTAIRRFFKALGDSPEFDGWKECMEESAENGYFKMNDFTMADGTRNPFPGFAYEIEEVNEGEFYIFLNIHPGEYEEARETITATADGRIPEEEYTYTETAPDRWTVTAWSVREDEDGEIIRRKCYTTSGLNEAQIRAQLANLEAWGYIIH